MTTEGLARIYESDIQVCPNPVFVIGAPRSGTSVLASALARHSDFWTSQETLILASMFGEGRIEAELQRWLERPTPSWLGAQNVDRTEFLGYLGVGFNALFTSRSGGKRWVDHTPHHAFMVDVLAEMFPGGSFLHIVRDGRAAVQSMLNIENTLSEEQRERMRAGNFLPKWTRSFQAACAIWRDSVEAATAAQERYPERVLTVSYARLNASPDDGFREILDFLGALDEDGPATLWRSSTRGSSFRGPAEGEARLASGGARWADWTPEQRTVFAEAAGLTMVRHGLATDRELGTVATP